MGTRVLVEAMLRFIAAAAHCGSGPTRVSSRALLGDCQTLGGSIAASYRFTRSTGTYDSCILLYNLLYTTTIVL